MSAYLKTKLQVANHQFTLYELNGLQRLKHFDELKAMVESQGRTDSPLKDFLKIDLEIQWQLVTWSIKGPRWWLPKWIIRHQVKQLGMGVLSELYLAACKLSNIPTPSEVADAEKKLSPSPENTSVSDSP